MKYRGRKRAYHSINYFTATKWSTALFPSTVGGLDKRRDFPAISRIIKPTQIKSTAWPLSKVDFYISRLGISRGTLEVWAPDQNQKIQRQPQLCSLKMLFPGTSLSNPRALGNLFVSYLWTTSTYRLLPIHSRMRRRGHREQRGERIKERERDFLPMRS